MVEIRRYDRVAIAFHWIIAILILTNIGLAWAWPNVADESVRPLINNHKAIGITVLGLVVLRILWRIGHRPPPLPPHHKPWERTAAHIVHWGLYVIMIGMPLTGWVMDSAWDKAAGNPNFYFGLFEWPRLGFIMDLDPATKKQVHDVFGAGHELIGKLTYLLVVLHVGGALKHQFFDKDRTLARMGIGRADA